MKVTARISWIAALVCLAIGAWAPAVQAAEFGIKTFEAGTCKSDTPEAPECSYSSPETQFYTQAAGHPQWGITGFEVNTEGSGAPAGQIKDVRVDIPPGLSVNPQAAPQCEKAVFETNTALCPSGSKVGEDEVTAFLLGSPVGPVSLPMYNLVPEEGVPAEFGFEVRLPPEPLPAVVDTRVLIVGGISWHHEAETGENSGVPTGDYHEFFTIKEISNQLEIVKSRLKFNGRAGNGSFLTLPSTCTTQKSYLHVDSYQNPGQFKAYETVSGDPPKAVPVSGCENVHFEPELAVKPATSQSDQPDGATVEVKVPQHLKGEEIDSSTLKDAHVTLPAGMTLNPSAVNGLEACTDAQFAKGEEKPVECPAGSQIGTVTIETPNLPPGSLVGNVYAGQPLSANPESGKEYRIFIDAESPRYGVAVRLLGEVIANAATGQLTTTVLENPPVPFSDFIVTLNGPHVPLANPLQCGEAAASALLTPYTGGAAASPLSSFPVDFDGKGGACPSTLPFALSQAAGSAPSTGGHTTSFTLSLARSDGNQYLGKVSTTLPPGLVAKVPSVQQCGATEANANKCPEASKIGVVSAAVGAGPNPLVLPGTVYFTGPYAGAPFGLLVSVPAEKVGPYDFGTIVTRATVNIDPYSARVIVGATLPTIVGGAPIRLKGLTVTVNRPNFTLNPTNCGVLATESLLTSTFGSTQLVSSPFQASGCSALGFKPIFKARTNAKASRRNGASFEVSVGYPAGAQANIKSVFVQLPKQLPSRLSTLNKACPETTFKANPAGCPKASAVGVASATTPVLPGTLSGPAYFVSHGGAAFPDLDVDLSGDGVKVILVGNTNIATGITTSTFASIPDVPVSSFRLKLPAGPFSALAARGNLCRAPLLMPTTITAQNGAVIKQNTRISVAGCKRHRARLRILSHRVRRHRVILTLRVPSAGRLVVGGHDLRTVHRRVGKARRLRVSVPLSRTGLRALARAHRHHHHLKLRVRARFVPKKGRASRASAVVRFR